MKFLWFRHGGTGLGFLGQPSVTTSPSWPGWRPIARLTHFQPSWLRECLRKSVVVFTLVGIALGIFLVAQWKSPLATTAPDATSRQATIRRTIQRLETEQVQLKKQIADLRAQTTAEQQQITQSQSASATLGKALAEQRTLAGTVPVKGQGIEVLLDDSQEHALSPSDDPDNYIVHEYQIRDVVNLLWGSGASAISVNGERFVNSTSVYCVGSTILINDTRTSPPYHILAVGDIARMQQALQDGNSLRDLKARADMYGLVFKMVKVGAVTVPAFDGSIQMKHTDIAYTTGQGG